ncbi:MAG: carboxypeptidase regulatory-like domain-containing protein [Armatimonadota bacterium]
MRKLAVVTFSTVFLLGAAAVVLAGPPQSDNFDKGLAPFWKAKQTTGGTTFPTPSYEVKDGRLIMRSADNDVWTTTWEPYFIYQDGITGDFTVQLKVLAVPQLNEWSHVGIMVCTTPIPDVYTDPSEIPTWWLVATCRNRTETKGGGQGQSRSISTNEGLQPPYWIRLDRQGSIIRTYYSLDGGKTWEQLNDDFNLEAENVQVPLQDPLAVGIHMQTHAGQTMGEAIVDNFQAGTIDQAGKLPGDAAAPAEVTGSVKDDKGEPVAQGTTVTATAADGTVLNARVDADGNFRMLLDPGSYTFGVASDEFEVPEAKPVEVAGGAKITQNLVVKPYPSIDLSTESADTSVTALVMADAYPGDLGPIAPGFKDTDWVAVDWPADLNLNPVNTNSWFWYRIKFAIPASFKAYKGRTLWLYNFNCDDSDVTFVNGHYVGHMLWM